MPIFDNDRINLLTDAEIAELYNRPEFTASERKYFFALDNKDHKLLEAYKKLKPKVYFVLQLGYFRAAKQFYKFNFQDVIEDVAYIIRTHFDAPDKLLTGRIWKETYRQQKNDILTLCGYNDWSTKHADQVEAHLEELVKFYPKGNDTLRELFVYFENNQIVIPSYRTLQDLFSNVFRTETERLNKIIASIPIDMQDKLENLIANDNGISQLNVIKVDQKDFQYNSLKSEIRKAQQIRGLYAFGKQFIPSLKLSRNAVRYYAGVAEQYTASRIRKLSKPQQWLHVMCFVDYRYQQFMDNLIASFIYHVRLVMEAAKKYAEEQASIYNASLMLDIPKLVNFLKWFPSDKVDPNARYNEFSAKGFQILPKEQFPLMADFIDGKSFDKEAAKWRFYEKSSRLFALYLRPILLNVDFEFQKSGSSMIAFIDLLKEHYSKKRSPAALKLSDDDDIFAGKHHVPSLLKSNIDDPTINPSRFEFYVYKKMYHQIDRGRLFCNDSVSYCSLEHDLVSDAVVDDVVAIANKFGYPKIPIYCEERLDTAIQDLEVAWDRTNQNIENGKNRSINIKQDQDEITWTLTYDADKSDENSPFFKDLRQIEIAELMKFVGDIIGFWDEFTHKKHRYIKQRRPEPMAILACVLSNAFGFGTKNMSEMSNIMYNHLRSIDENFIRTETLYAVNDKVSNFLYSLPIIRVWDLKENLIIADADGQKFECSRHTIQSRHSPKYFGTYKGVSVYSLIANNVPVNSKIIGPNEHESHHLYDVVYSNVNPQ